VDAAHSFYIFYHGILLEDIAHVVTDLLQKKKQNKKNRHDIKLVAASYIA